jgi:UDP-N-acetylmuramate dehydrogenase
VLVEDHVELAPRTTFGIGGPARRFVRIGDVGELAEALRTEDRVLVLGGGSNVLVSDAGWDGLVIQIGLTSVKIHMHDDHAIVSAFAGAEWDRFVAQSIEAKLVGLECMSGIPGLVGATPMQNVGAYGQEVADTLELVRAFDRTTGQVVTFARSECGFAYRSSMFKGSQRWIILEARFRLARGNESAPIRYPELARALGIAEGERAPLEHVRSTVIRLRRGKGMVIDAADPESRSAGSFFVNPIVGAATVAELDAVLPPGVVMPRFPQSDGRIKLSAGWLIERAGFAKGYTRGRAGISSKHALALVNRGGATATEILALAREIQDGVRDKLGIALLPEVQILSEVTT